MADTIITILIDGFYAVIVLGIISGLICHFLLDDGGYRDY